MASATPTDAVPSPAASRKDALGWRHRLAVAGRVSLAAVGGYAVAALATALGSVTLPLPRAEAVSAATLASFAVMAAAVVYVFASRSLGRATLGLGGAAALLAAALWLAGGFTAPVPA